MGLYGFVCLFRADVSASGLAFRIPQLWLDIYRNHNKNTYLIVNKSLFDKVLSGAQERENIYVIPEVFGFKFSMALFVPFLLLYLIFIKKMNKIHLSNGGAFFAKFLKVANKFFLGGKLVLHTSIGSKNLDMITGGDFSSRYYKLHIDLLNAVDKVDCLYSPDGFPDYAAKCIQSPGSFSWKYSTHDILNIDKSAIKNDILFCGSFLPQKNYRLAIDSYVKFYTDCKLADKPRLYIVAPSVPENIQNEILTINDNKTGEIIFLDIEQLESKLSEIYVFLSLQDYDNYPSQSLIESMIFGCTVIATNFGETSRLVDPNYNSLVRKEVDDVVAALIFYFNKPSYFNSFNNEIIVKNHTIAVYSDYFYNNFVR